MKPGFGQFNRPSRDYLKFCAQFGVKDVLLNSVTLPSSGGVWQLHDIIKLRLAVEQEGLTLSALENDVITPKLKVNCRGHKHPLELYGMKYHCWKKNGHGYMSLSNAIKQSCDTYFYEAARLLGVDRLNETAKKYGLGDRVLGNIFLDEKKGIVPSTKWKKMLLVKIGIWGKL